MAEYELECVNEIEAFLSGFRPSTGPLSGPLRHLRIRWQDTSIRALIAPKTYPDSDHAQTVIALGSPAYNSVSQYIESNFPDFACCSDGFHKLEIPSKVGTPRDDFRAFILERVINQTSGQRYFGPSSI
jgi:hypothetical protein